MKYAYNKVNKIQNVWNFALCTILNAHSIPTTDYLLPTTYYLLPTPCLYSINPPPNIFPSL